MCKAIYLCWPFCRRCSCCGGWAGGWGRGGQGCCCWERGVLFCGWSAPFVPAGASGRGVASYLLGRRIIRAGAHKKGLLIAGAAGLLAVLAWFKYTGFVLSLTPWEGLFAPPGWLAPLGLSFVTFQQIFWLRTAMMAGWRRCRPWTMDAVSHFSPPSPAVPSPGWKNWRPISPASALFLGWAGCRGCTAFLWAWRKGCYWPEYSPMAPTLALPEPARCPHGQRVDHSVLYPSNLL